MASYTLTIYDIPQIINKKYISISYNSNGEKSTCTIHTENRTWICTLQDLSYSKAIYKPGELIFKLQITGCSGVNAICSTFKGKKIELTAQADNKSSSIAKEYYIFGIQIEKKGNVYYATFQAYDPFKFLTLDKYCKAYTGKKFIQDIFLNKELWPNNITDKNLKGISIEDIDATQKKIKELNEQIKKETDSEKKKELEKQRNEEEENLVVKKGQFIIIPKAKYLTYKMGSETKEFIQPYLVQYNESFFDFLVRVSNRCGEFLYYEDGFFNIGLNIEKDNTGRITSKQTSITEYVSVNFSNETTTAWKENYIVNKHNNYADGFTKTFPYLDLNETELKKDFGENYKIINDNGKELTIKYKIEKNDKGEKTDEDKTDNVKRSKYEQNKDIMLCQNSHLTSDENLVSLPPKDKYTKWGDFALWPGCYLINVFTDIVNSANIAEAIANVTFSTFATSMSSLALAADANNNYETEYFNNKNDIYKKERKNDGHIHPFSTSEENKNTTLSSYVTFSLEFYETVRKGIEANERSRIQIALGDHFYPLSLGSLIELDGQQYIVVQMNGCASSNAETLDIEAIPYKENEFVFPPAAPVSPIREAKAQRAFITHNTDPLKMNRVRVRYPWQGNTEDPTPWIRIALPMASDSSGFNFLPQIGDEAIINYENGNIEKPYVEGMLYTKAAEEDESTVPYAFKQDKARVISSVNGHSIIFSDPPASTNVFNGLIPLWKTINSFYPTVLKGKLPDYNKKAMGGIEFTDEHGLYSISMSSDKRAISIDSPLGKVDINAFTGITISAPNGNVRIEGKNIDIVAGNNLSISSGNNIASHFWHMKDKKWKEGWKDFGKTMLTDVLSKIEVIDMNLIRTAFETIVRPCGGTMLIKSNRYLCFEAGKGEAQIAGRQTVKQLGLRATIGYALTPDQLRRVTIPYQNNNDGIIVATNRIPIHINNVIQAIRAAKEAFDTINANISNARNAYKAAYNKFNKINIDRDNFVNPKPQEFDTLYPDNIDNFNALNMQNEPAANAPESERFKKIKTHVEVLNKNALFIKGKQLTQNKIWDDFTEVYLQDPVVRKLITESNNLNFRTDLEKLFKSSTTKNYLTNKWQALDVVTERVIVYQILVGLINHQTTTETKDSTHCSKNKIRLVQPIQPNDDAQWTNLINNNNNNYIKYDDQNPVQLRKRDKARLGIMKSKFLGLHKLDGMLDQYIWDTNEDAGKILFSDQEGETLNFQNKEIHYYKKSETDPLAKLKQILRSIQ